QFTKFVENGTYTSKLVSYEQRIKYYNIYPSIKTSTFTNSREIDSVIFRLEPIAGIQDLQVSIVPKTAARPGNPSTYDIVAQNTGTKIVYQPVIKFIKDYRQLYDSSLSTLYTISADTLFIPMDSLGLYEVRKFSIYLKNGIPPALNIQDTLHLVAQILPFVNDTFVI